MSVTHYAGSRGPVEIATMPLPYASNALAKLQRERVDASRDREIAALSDHVARLQEEQAESEVGMEHPQRAEADPPPPIGDNGPPPDTAFEAVRAHMDDLLVEAHNWADGATVESQAQADEASRLIDDLRKAAKAAEDLRIAEKKPFDDGIAEIQGRYNPYIADPKTKNPGRVWKAIDALKATVKPYLDKMEAERQRVADERRKAAEDAARRAAEAARAAQASDLGAQEAAELLVAEAKSLDQEARQIEKDRVQARGGERAMGLRTVRKPVMVDPKAALSHYATTRREDVIAFLQRLAEVDVREGKRAIPGFDVRQGTTL